eukprot:scaffold1054_cov124-Cylindrotheca_fusiformis.AAC.17
MAFGPVHGNSKRRGSNLDQCRLPPVFCLAGLFLRLVLFQNLLYAYKVHQTGHLKLEETVNIWLEYLVVLDSIDMQDFTGITGNMAKFVLGFATIFFDHYILYPSSNKDTEHEDKNDGIPRQIKTPTLERAMVKTSSRLNLSHDGVANADMEI